MMERGEPIFTDGQQFIGFIGVCNGRDQRISAEQELQHQKDFYPASHRPESQPDLCERHFREFCDG